MSHISIERPKCSVCNEYAILGGRCGDHAVKPLPRLGLCSCRPGIERDNCPNCEGSGLAIDWLTFHLRNRKITICE